MSDARPVVVFNIHHAMPTYHRLGVAGITPDPDRQGQSMGSTHRTGCGVLVWRARWRNTPTGSEDYEAENHGTWLRRDFAEVLARPCARCHPDLAGVMPLARFTATVRPGSQDPPWSWRDEALELWRREPAAMADLAADVAANGQQAPVTIGDDRRLWDGHHRVVALLAVGARTVRTRRWDDLTADEQHEATVEAVGDAEQRQEAHRA